jgi:hypothetical protein
MLESSFGTQRMGFRFGAHFPVVDALRQINDIPSVVAEPVYHRLPVIVSLQRTTAIYPGITFLACDKYAL